MIYSHVTNIIFYATVKSLELLVYPVLLTKVKQYSKNSNILKDHMILKTGVMMLKFKLYITGIHYIVKHIQIENIYFTMLIKKFKY